MFILKTNLSNSLLIFTAAISSLMMVSCSSDDDSGDGGFTAVQPSQNFDSVWVRDCRPIANGTSFIDIVTIEGITSERTRETYSDSDCQLLAFSTTNGVTAEFGEPDIDASSGLTTYPVDLTVTEIRITPGTQELADTYNEASECGVSNYAINEATVVPIDCQTFSGFLSTGIVFGLWALDGDLLYFGGESNTVEERPTELLFQQPFRRQ